MLIAEVKRKLHNDPDFVFSKRCGFSLTRMIERHPDGCSDRIIAASLLITEEEVEVLYQNAIEKLRVVMKVE